MAYYGDGTDELQLAFNFPLITAPFEAEPCAPWWRRPSAASPPGGGRCGRARTTTCPAWRPRWADGHPGKIRVALMMLLCLRGTPMLYQGDEIGLGTNRWGATTCATPSVSCTGRPTPAATPCAPRCRGTPAPVGGFTEPGTQPWLPLDDPAACNVEDQRADGGSVLSFTRDLIAVRRRTAELRHGEHVTLAAPDGVWAWQRGEHVTVVLSLGAEPATVAGVEGVVRIATDRTRDGLRVGGSLEVGGWEGVVVEREPSAPPAIGVPAS